MNILKLKKTTVQEVGLFLVCGLIAIGIDSASAQEGDLLTKEYLVPSTYLSSGPPYTSAAADPFADPTAN